MTFGEKIKRFRVEKGLTQASLAGMIGSSREKIQKYENGVNEPPFEIVVKLADIFQVCIDQLLRMEWSCPLKYPETANVARKVSELTDKEMHAVNRLVDELLEREVGLENDFILDRKRPEA